MAKIYKVVDPLEPVTSSVQQEYTDWSKCFICQENSNEPLRCPAHSKRGTEGVGYKTIIENLVGFQEISALPKSLTLTRLDDGDGIETTLMNKEGKFHESCRLRYNKTKLLRAGKRKSSSNDSYETEQKHTRKSLPSQSSTVSCFFCGSLAPDETLHEVTTFELDTKVRQCAMKLQDTVLLAKLSAGDMIAQEAKYHSRCLVTLYNRARDFKSAGDKDTDEEKMHHGLAFASLLSYIEDIKASDDVAPIFKMTDLADLYDSRLKQLGTNMGNRIHTTKLKNRILAYFPDLEAHKQGRDVVLVCNKDIGNAIKKACEYDADSDAVHLVRAANAIRRDMFKMKTKFQGKFTDKCQEDSVPASLVALVSMILMGPNIKAQMSCKSIPQSVLTISQLVMFNSIVRRRIDATSSKHSSDRQPPLPVYLGMMLHTKTRKKELVDKCFKLGLSVSYDEVLNISSSLGNAVCVYYNKEDVVCPPHLNSNLFTTAAVDNLDHNPSSTTAHGSFHGTGISLFQNPTEKSQGETRAVLDYDYISGPFSGKLLESYTHVPPVFVRKENEPVPKVSGLLQPDLASIEHATQEEHRYITSEDFSEHLASMIIFCHYSICVIHFQVA